MEAISAYAAGVAHAESVVTIRQYLMRRCNRAVSGTIAFLVVTGALVSSGPRMFVIRFVFAVVMAAVVVVLEKRKWSDVIGRDRLER